MSEQTQVRSKLQTQLMQVVDSVKANASFELIMVYSLLVGIIFHSVTTTFGFEVLKSAPDLDLVKYLTTFNSMPILALLIGVLVLVDSIDRNEEIDLILVCGSLLGTYLVTTFVTTNIVVLTLVYALGSAISMKASLSGEKDFSPMVLFHFGFAALMLHVGTHTWAWLTPAVLAVYFQLRETIRNKNWQGLLIGSLGAISYMFHLQTDADTGNYVDLLTVETMLVASVIAVLVIPSVAKHFNWDKITNNSTQLLNRLPQNSKLLSKLYVNVDAGVWLGITYVGALILEIMAHTIGLL